MEVRLLGKDGPKVSAVALGTWAMAGNSYGEVDDRDSIYTVHAALDCGITLIDTAASYGGGNSERVLGRALEGKRDRAFVCTKCGIHPNKERTALEYDLKPSSIRKELEASLRNLRTDWIDLYQFHYPDPDTPLEESLGEMERLREEGKIRYIGVSNFDLVGLKRAAGMCRISSLQIKYSLLDREEEALIDYCGQNGIGVLTYGSIAGGMLSGKFKTPPDFEPKDTRERFYPYFREPAFSRCRMLVDVLEKIAQEKGCKTVQIAVAWVLAQKGVTCALVGAKRPKQAEENAAAARINLTGEELKRIEEAFRRYCTRDGAEGTHE
jgi:aryl-alcohol dehydrogenase-like predicted oxidoreductase